MSSHGEWQIHFLCRMSHIARAGWGVTPMSFSVRDHAMSDRGEQGEQPLLVVEIHENSTVWKYKFADGLLHNGENGESFTEGLLL